MKNALRRKMGSLAGRPENGRWLIVVTEDPLSNAVDVPDLQERGGRLNPPKSFPTAYLSEDNEACRTRIAEWIRTDADKDRKFVALLLDIQVEKVLDLGEAATRRRLGISLAALSDPADMSLSRSIGSAAHHAGFAGVVYPRPAAKGARNLALFCDRTTSLQVRMAETSPLAL